MIINKRINEAIEVLKCFDRCNMFYWIQRLDLTDSEKGYIYLYLGRGIKMLYTHYLGKKQEVTKKQVKKLLIKHIDKVLNGKVFAVSVYSDSAVCFYR